MIQEDDKRYFIYSKLRNGTIFRDSVPILNIPRICNNLHKSDYYSIFITLWTGYTRLKSFLYINRLIAIKLY